MRPSLSPTVLLALCLLAAVAIALLPGPLTGGLDAALSALKLRQRELQTALAAHPLSVTCVFFGVYVALSALALPGGSVLMLAAGAGYGLLPGTLLSLSACTLGATLTMLAARHLLRGPARRHFGARLTTLDAGLARDGGFYLFSLRMLPVIPYAAVNVLAGLTGLRTWTFAWVSFAGMLAGTVVYVNAGQELARVESMAQLLSPSLLAALAALGLLPLLARKLFARPPDDRQIVQ